jgi:hypothetical protein
MVLFHLVAAVGVPLLFLGMAYGGARYAANGTPDASFLIGNALCFLAFLGALASGFLSDPDHPFQPFVAIVTSLMLAGAVIGIVDDVDSDILRSRGVSTSCKVLDVDRREHTSTYTDSNGVTHTTTTVDYKHKLDCAAGQPDSMTLSKKHGDKGDRIDVTYDPKDRLSPLPTETVESDGVWHAIAQVFPPLAIGLRLLALAVAGGAALRRGRR